MSPRFKTGTGACSLVPDRGLVLVFALVIGAASLAGCVGSPEEGIPANLEVTAERPLVASGWDQSGRTLVETSGQARLLADNATGSGSFSANVTLGDAVYELSADTFQSLGDQPWTANGVNQSLSLHGDTGRGTDELPRVDAVVATWGPIVLSRSGEVLPDPLTGDPELFAHVFLLEEGIRSDEDGWIRAEDGSVYSPAQAGSGRTHADDAELHAVVTSDPEAPTFEDERIQKEGEFEPPASNASVRIPVEERTGVLNVTVSVAPPADVDLTPAEVNATLVDPDGGTLRAATLGAQTASSITWSLETLPTSGNYSVQMESQGSARWNVSADVAYPDPFVFHVTYEDVAWSPASEMD